MLSDHLRLCLKVVTCGSTPLESSYQKIPRCVYVSTELYEYKGCSWGSRHAEVSDSFFYISIIVNLIQVVPSLIFEMVIVCLFVCVAEICFGFLHL